MIAASLGERIVASDDWYGSPSFIDGTVTESVQEWTELLSMHAAAMEAGTPLDTPRMRKALLNGGVPPSMRAKVWLAFSGAGKRMRSHPNVYAQLCKNVAAHFEGGAGTTAQEAQGGPEADSTCVEGAVGTAGSSSSGGGSGGGSSSGSQQIAHRVLEQVEKDLRRTDVGENGTEKLGAMRRVLCAFAAFNPDVGYVQGMNFIVVALLGVFDEAASFWMLALIVDQWLPEHFSSAMIGYHIDCRVLSTLTAEHLPRLANRLNQLDVTVQLLTTRWFLCLWSSVLADSALHRLWDCLFVSGPEMSMQAALACMHLCEPAILEARDIGDALCVAKDALRAVGDGAVLLDIMLARLPEMSREQLFSWRMHCRQLVINETRHVQATRRLLRLQRGSGFSLSELKLMARLCGPYTIAPSNAASSLLNLAIDFESFVRVLRGLVPQWSNHPTAGWREASAVSRPAPHAPPHPPAPADAVCTLSERIFVLFFSLSADGRHGEPHDLAAETRRREHSVGSIESAVDALDSSSSGTGLCERPALTFEQLVSGLGWLLRGTSQRRADLCFRCFEDPDGAGSGRAGQTHGAGGSSSVGSSSSGADSSRGAVGDRA